MGKKGKRRSSKDVKNHGDVGPKATATNSTRRHAVQNFPLAFPPSLKVPKDEFLRNVHPYTKSFQAALDTSYEGFVVDDSKQNFDHESIAQALQVLEQRGFFRTDVTQPFGLGTKCAKTYVTRCLLGFRGNTYKYLGLRMFAYPWEPQEQSKNDAASTNLQNAIETIRQLNEKLAERTTRHLEELDKKRSNRGGVNQGILKRSKKFDITLINRMEYSHDLKPEPSMGDGKCSVRWHADSSLEHYSTIAVYHAIFEKNPAKKNSHDLARQWSVALRVAHNSEGPNASHRGTDMESSINRQTPPIAVSLPSGSAYYLLDDFNHHHQHAVLASEQRGTVRFSSTHRLLRTSHNVEHILERCRLACGNFHKKGPKVWRSEQLLLTELESEWLRQYYIQGRLHHELLWRHWEQSIKSLWRHWSQLESRTKQTMDLLDAAARGKCAKKNSDTKPSRAERKMREKQRKACATLEELLSRSGGENPAQNNALETMYEPFALLLEERATIRALWSKRESDHVFRELGRDGAPIPFPVQFNELQKESDDPVGGSSPIKGSPQDLRCVANTLRSLGKAFMTSDSSHLPQIAKRSKELNEQHAKQEIGQEPREKAKSDSLHSKTESWEGWNQYNFGLEMQSPWADLLLDGRKHIETRLYDLPKDLIGKRIEILKSQKGTSGVSSLGNIVQVGNKNDGASPAVEVAGWCNFSRVIKYESKHDFEADEADHLVARDSGYGWDDKKTKAVYGWVVQEYGRYTRENLPPAIPVIRRRMRSIFQLEPGTGISAASMEHDLSRNKHVETSAKEKRRGSFKSNKRKKKKRY